MRFRSALRASAHLSSALSPSCLAACRASARDSPVVGGMGMWISRGEPGGMVGGAGREREEMEEKRDLMCYLGLVGRVVSWGGFFEDFLGGEGGRCGGLEGGGGRE